MKKQAWFLFFLLIGCFSIPLGFTLDFPGPDIGVAQGRCADGILELSNNAISCQWRCTDGRLDPLRVTDRLTGMKISLQSADLFRLTLEDDRILSSNDLKVINEPVLEALKSEPSASNLARRFPGRQITVRLTSDDGKLIAIWRAILRDGANAIRQEIEFTAVDEELLVKDIRLVKLPSPGVQVIGSVPGSPIVLGNLFFAYEHPNAIGTVSENHAECALNLHVCLKPGQPFTQSCVIGVVPEGQRRRGFLYYVERERAHPYRPFLHYNSWYDISWGGIKNREDECLRVINIFGHELIEKRDVELASFVWDDGWDDPKTLWRAVKRNYPNGFINILAAARNYNTTLGFWMSPFGGYGNAAKDRFKYGEEQGFEFKDGRFALAGPKYYARFLETCTRMIETNGSNFFKFDGLTRDVAETEAMLKLTRELRRLRPDLFVSITTGTWPSPYWLWYGDSTWRGRHDMGLHGAGSKREQWITYRDMVTYQDVVCKAPLYPINSLMNQGIAQARYGLASEIGDAREEIRHEIRSFFACGTCLQELYITPERLTAADWDDLAEGAKWSMENADVLADTHWIGGDPGKGEIYGWASWSKHKGILALRNPSENPSSISVDIETAFELPQEALTKYTLKSPWKSDHDLPEISVEAGSLRTFKLKPFEVLVYDAIPIAD